MNNDDELCDNNGNSSKDERNGQKKTPRLRKNEDGHIKVQATTGGTSIAEAGSLTVCVAAASGEVGREA